jgi:hypothetical protein
VDRLADGPFGCNGERISSEPTTPEEVAPYSGYYRALCDMVGSLGNRRIGAQWDHK